MTSSKDDDNPAAKPSAAYQVGRGKPPTSSRFKKGQSGNPNGRPKGSRSLRASLEKTLGQKVQVRDGGRVKWVAKVDVLNSMMVNAALKGDVNVGLKVIALANQTLNNLARNKQKLIESLTDQEILEIAKDRKLATCKPLDVEKMSDEDLDTLLEILDKYWGTASKE